MRVAAAAALLLAACASAPTPAPEVRPTGGVPAEPTASRGLTCENAIVIEARNEDEGIKREYAWIRENYPGYKRESQDLLMGCADRSRPTDAIHIVTANGEKVTLYFDISKWFGKY
jgi:hypothetical protein